MNIATKLVVERRARLAELKEAKLRTTNTAPSIIRYIHIYPDIY
jgi:hypothetical protein